MCTSDMPIRFTLKVGAGQEDPSMRKLSEGKRSPKAPLKSAPTSHNAENPRRIRADSAGVLKYETHQHLRQRTRYTAGFSLRGEPQRERRTPAQPSR